MASKEDLQDWVHQALKALGGRGSIVEIAKHIWANREAELRKSGNLFFTWQYDMRWAGNALRRKSIMKSQEVSPVGIWELAE